MRALRFHGREDVRIDDIEEPEVRPGTVGIQVHANGVCGSDLHEYQGGPIFIPSEEPHPLTGETLPVVMGHEFAGEVYEIGEGVEHLRVGDHVTIEPILRDNDCSRCRRGAYNLCVNLGFHGLMGGGGGMSERTVVPSYMVHPLPEGMSTDIGALAEPVAVGLHGVRQSGFRPGQHALVLGAGPIGLVTAMALRASGAASVVVGEVAAARKAMAERLAADAVFDPTEVEPSEVARDHTRDGFDVVFDAAGIPATFAAALEAVKPEGTVSNLAIWEKPTELQPNQLVLGEINLTGAIAYAGEYPAVIQMLHDGRIDAEPLITGRVPLEDAVEGAFEELIANKAEHIKILVKP